MDTGAGSSTIPNFDSTFPVDFSFFRQVNDTSSFMTSARLIAKKKLITNGTDAEVTDNNNTFDSNVGWNKNNGADSNFQSWMWKRHAGFDVVAYTGNGVTGNQIPHSMNKTPEMIWIKARGQTFTTYVYHKDFNGGTNPEQYVAYLSMTNAETDNAGMLNDTAPTSTHFTLGNFTGVNADNNTFIAMLFASVDGISKVGSYDGNDSGVTLDLGFQPRFIMIKCRTSSGAYRSWFVLDTIRGWGSGNDKWLRLDGNDDQNDGTDWGAPTSTGCTITGGDDNFNSTGESYIYYAHA